MNIALIGLLSVFSFSSFAMKVVEFDNKLNGERSAFIENPELGDSVPFDSRSEPNGVCKSLGYSKGVPGAARIVSISGLAVIVDSTGSITGGSNNRYKLTNIVCVDKVKERMWNGRLINNPIHPDSVPFDSRSSQIGACIALGYDTGAQGAEKIASISDTAVIVDSSGLITGGTNNMYKLSQLICFNRNRNH